MLQVVRADQAKPYLSTPTPSRRNSQMTLLRFFSVQFSSSVAPDETATVSGPSDVSPPPVATPLTPRTPTKAVDSN
ncbi:GL13202 [Drosophila persimilis]|uniref:GL13202 n=1 Tax=Drosophila persimilis TaxID=7234 RepID=B4H3Q9_DROPE|nr:GL15160 [Drosophila persimilis]EDW34909.1 GL13202 [Drosophila persimilis]